MARSTAKPEASTHVPVELFRVGSFRCLADQDIGSEGVTYPVLRIQWKEKTVTSLDSYETLSLSRKLEAWVNGEIPGTGGAS